MKRRGFSVVSRAAVTLGLSALVSHCSSDASDAPGNGSALAGTGAGGATSTISPSSPKLSGWTITFSDEFEGEAGTALDKTKWNQIRQGDGFGNNELEFYTDRTDNVSLDGEGFLNIVAREEKYENRDYTSGRIETHKKFEQQYGRIEARIKLPTGQGIWPAFWMLGNDVLDVSWPDCGEIDIVENIGSEPTIIHGSLQGPGYAGENPVRSTYSLPDDAAFSDDFHLYAVEWEADAVRFYVDEDLFETRTPEDLPDDTRWVFDHPFYMLMNVAVGGNYPGAPDETTVFPQIMQVDYVRVYQRE